jgi:tetratricopeptide (TPR) repeat protein
MGGQIVKRQVLLALMCIVVSQSATFAQDSGSPAGATTSLNGLVQNSLSPIANDCQSALNMGDYDRAKTLAQNALNSLGKNQTQDELALRVVLGETYLNQGNFTDAAKELDKAMKLANKASSSDQAYARVLDDMSWVYQTQNKQDLALQMLDQALAAQRKISEGSAELADILEHAGWVAEQQGQFAKATPYFEEALTIRQKKDPNSVALANDLEHVWSNSFRLGQSKPDLYAQALSIKENTQDIFKSFAPHDVSNTVVFSFRQGAPNCALGSQGGLLQQSITANQVTIDAAIAKDQSNFAKSERAYVRINNQSNQPVQILMQRPSFIVLKPKIQFIGQIESTDLASKIEKKGDSKAKWIRFWGSQATQTMTTNVMQSGNMMNSYGYFPPTFGYGYPYMPYPGYMPGNRNQSSMTTMMTSVPDYEARARAMEKANAVTAQSAQTASDIRENALGPVTVQPGRIMEGSLYFQPTDFKEAILRVPAGNSLFEFRFIR